LRFYQESELFLFPTKRIEGFPMVLVEAMLAGLPVVGFDLGGVSDAVFNNETGFLVKDGDVAGFKDALFKLVSDKHLRQSFGKNARIKAETEFTSKLMLANYEKVLLENTL
jgi:glycosyltransferase involved in cell wall biosynthesis